jgi:Fe-S oxidoreductase
MEAVKARIDATIDACTRCGKCVEVCPMVEPAGLDPANGVAIATGVIDLLAGGAGTPDAERWAQVCTNSGKCIPACDYGVNPRFMVNMARIASMNLRQGEAEVRRGAQQYFNTMGRSTRTISRLQLSPEVLERVAPKIRTADEYEAPDVVFYTGCNVIKTPHIALLTLEVLDALGINYEVMGGTAACCGNPAIQARRRQDRRPRRFQHDRPAGASRRLKGRVVVPELHYPDRRGGAAGL